MQEMFSSVGRKWVLKHLGIQCHDACSFQIAQQKKKNVCYLCAYIERQRERDGDRHRERLQMWQKCVEVCSSFSTFCRASSPLLLPSAHKLLKLEYQVSKQP